MSGEVAGPRRYAVANFGCKANAYDGRQIEASLRTAGWEAGAVGDDGAPPELLVVNTCSVTASADRQRRNR